MKIFSHVLVLLAAVFLGLGPAHAKGNVGSGKKVFAKCKACHTLKTGKHRFGPSLAGVIGRKAGTAPGYKYSKAMRAYGASGIVWNEQTLDTYLANPKKVVKGTKMSFPGLKKLEQRADIIAFLNDTSKPSN